MTSVNQDNLCPHKVQTSKLSSNSLKPLHSVLIAAGLLTAFPALAVEFELGKEIEGALDVTTSYSTGWRTEDIDEGILNPNNDDGDRAFGNKGNVTSSIFKVVYDLSLKKQLDRESAIGFFNRGIMFYDDKIKNATNKHNSPATNSSSAFFGGSLTSGELNTFTQATQDRAGYDAKWLDAYVYINGNQQSDYAYSIKIGDQVINWGESAFIQSGITNAVNAADVTQANLPGTEIKEILLPQSAIYTTLSLSENLSLEAYYQWKWQHTIAPPAGTFLSTNDFIAEDGGETLLLPPPDPMFSGSLYQRGANIDASDSGQYGVALRWFSEELNNTEFGFYYLNYHSKLPSLAISGAPLVFTAPDAPFPGGPGASQYHIEYFDDISLTGFSFNTVLFDIAFSGEVAYHQDVPLQTIALGGPAVGQAVALALTTGAPLSLSTREDMIVAQLTVNHSLNNTPFIGDLADDVGLLVEFGLVNTPDLNGGEVFRGPVPVDSSAWGYKSQLTLTYFNKLGEMFPTISGTDLVVGLLFNHDVEGTSAIAAGSFTDNAKSAAVSFKGTWQSEVEVELRYNTFFGSEASGLTDRDNISLTAKYRF